MIKNMEIFDYFLYSSSTSRKNKRIYYKLHDPKYEYSLCVYQKPSGEYYVLTDVGKFFNSKTKCRYCMECNIWYENSIVNGHNNKCPLKCSGCLRIGTRERCKEDFPISCVKCYKQFNNKECFDYHLAKNMCGVNYKCLDCNSNIDLDKHRQKSLKFNRFHACNELKCYNCFSYHTPYSKCLIK